MKLKKDGTPKKSGGARTNTRLQAKLTDPTVLADWRVQLKRAICTAASNSTVLRKNSFFTTREIKSSFGKNALAEFKDWFEAKRHFNQEEGDRLYQERAAGKIDDAKFSKLLFSKAFFWVWSIRAEKQREAWAISRSLKDLV